MSRVFRIIGWIENIVLFILIGLLFYLSIPLEGEKNIYLQADNTGGIISQLHQKGYDVCFIDKYLLKLIGKPLPGHIFIGSHTSERLAFLYKLTTPRSHYKIITLIPGETNYFFLRNLAKILDQNLTKLRQAYMRLSPYPEAGIMADSYHIPLHLKEKEVIKMLLDISKKRYKKLSQEYLGKWDPKEWEKILTIASIIQKEAANYQEMPLIASVIYNRLSKNMRLQMDGTLNYGRFSHTRITPERIKKDKSDYNTYKHRGLPAHPVCAVSLPSIKATLNPAQSKFLYFMKNNHGTHDFSTTYKSHLKNIQERKKELLQ